MSRPHTKSSWLAIEKLEARTLLTAVCSAGRDDWTVGLVDCTSEASEGYTLVAPNASSNAYLVDVHGREVHAWENGPYNSRFAAYLADDGSLVSSAVTGGQIGGAGATGTLTIRDWEGNLTWDWTYSNAEHRLHHDIEVMPNGNILAMAFVAVSQADMIAAGRNPAGTPAGGVRAERIIEVQPTGPTSGTIVWEWNAMDHLIQDFDAGADNFGVVSDHPELMDVNFVTGTGSDWLHFNAVDYNVDLDQIVVSSPNFNELWVIDHSTTTAEAASHAGGNSGMGGDLLYRWGNPRAYDRGTPADQQLEGQHDVQWIDNELPGAGNILIFNNRSFGSPSILVEISPPVDMNGDYSLITGMAYGPEAPTWTLNTGVASRIMSGVQRMPNGNTMAAFAVIGEIRELTPSGDVVWHYVNPDNGNVATQGSNASGGVLFKSRRYAPDFAGFDGRDLSASGYVENWLPGDYNLNGGLDPSDVDALCGGLSTGDLIYDINFDDVLDAADVAELVDQMGFLLGDANLDGFVDGVDFLAWNANKFTPNNLWSNGDFNCDGFVDGLDFIIWNQNKFTSSPVAAPPNTAEPTVAPSAPSPAVGVPATIDARGAPTSAASVAWTRPTNSNSEARRDDRSDPSDESLHAPLWDSVLARF